MKVEKKGHTTIIKNTQGDISPFVEKLTNEYNSFGKQNLIVDISHQPASLKDIRLFSDLSKRHRKAKHSFVVVASAIDFNAVPAQLMVVPSLQEAKDIIEMEEIERDLGF